MENRHDIHLSFLILIWALFLTSCSQRLVKIEEKALGIYCSEIIANRNYFIGRPENEIDFKNSNDSIIWSQKGIFGDKVFSSSGELTQLSKPYYDETQLPIIYDVGEELLLSEAKGFIADYRAKSKEQLGRNKIKLPNSFSLKTFKDFEETASNNEVYLEVKYALVSRGKKYLVEISAILHTNEKYVFYIFLNKKGKLLELEYTYIENQLLKNFP